MLTKFEKAVRQTLIRACRGEIETHHHRKITYKELWEHHAPSGAAWGRGCTSAVVRWIVNISDDDVANNRPPLNALVVRRDTKQPGFSWEEWRKAAGKPFASLPQAQEACWKYWSEPKKKRSQ